MRFGDLLSIAFLNLWRRKLRAFLTVLGMTIGVASIVVMVSLGIGISQGYIDSMAATGELTNITVNSQTYYGGGGRMYDSGTGNSQLRETELTENQDIVEYHIRKHHDNGVQSQCLCLCRTNKECTEHHHDKREKETIYTPMDITFGCIINMW